MLKSSSLCLHSSYLGTFWLKIEQFWPFEEISVGHNFERDPPRVHPCQVWFNLVQRFQRRRFKCDFYNTA